MNEFKWRQKNGIQLHLWEMSDGHLKGSLEHLHEQFPDLQGIFEHRRTFELSPAAWVAAISSEMLRRKVAADAAAADAKPASAPPTPPKSQVYPDFHWSRERSTAKDAQPERIPVTNFREQAEHADRTIRNGTTLRVPSDPAARAKFFQSAEFLGRPEHERVLIRAVAEIINR